MMRSGWALDFGRSSKGGYVGEQLDAVRAQRGVLVGIVHPAVEMAA
jgi:hypothetical protein